MNDSIIKDPIIIKNIMVYINRLRQQMMLSEAIKILEVITLDEEINFEILDQCICK
jgi:hypothetical protein